ncbi:MAG TPA: intradiol ring-cleavage dioxygenase [Ignavibacteria bacterium]|nr:intradiol ring-cleavage dioxygenase [Ignavibacteria bacterium]
MLKIISFLVLSLTAFASGCGQTNKTDSTSPILSREIRISDGCEDCTLIFEGMPSFENMLSETSIANSNEPGEPLEISGTIFMPDGKTPAPDILLYIYHTDNKGLYSQWDTQTVGKRHGHLRGWMKTDKEGKYKFTTIRPASYPNSNNPQHIHPIIKEPYKTEYWIDDYLFEDDPLMKGGLPSYIQNRAGNGIIKVAKNENGVWMGKRDLILGLNIPNYR